MAIAYRVRCACGATIARGTYEELTAAMIERDWQLEDDHTAICLDCIIAG